MKKMIVNCASCDMRTVSEETLQSYEQIVVNSALVLVTPRTKELLNRYNVMLNTADMMEVPEGDNVRLNSQNGSYELTSDGMPEAGVIALLMVNGSLTVGEVSHLDLIDLSGVTFRLRRRKAEESAPACRGVEPGFG